MIKAKIRYTDCYGDTMKVNRILALHKVDVIKTSEEILGIGIVADILVKNDEKLNELMIDLNTKTSYGVRVKKRTNLSE